jgi:hypothetical protein
VLAIELVDSPADFWQRILARLCIILTVIATVATEGTRTVRGTDNGRWPTVSEFVSSYFIPPLYLCAVWGIDLSLPIAADVPWLLRHRRSFWHFPAASDAPVTAGWLPVVDFGESRFCILEGHRWQISSRISPPHYEGPAGARWDVSIN